MLHLRGRTAICCVEELGWTASTSKVIGCLLRNAPGDAGRDRRRGRAVGTRGQAADRPAGRHRGAIRGFTALIDPDVLGWQTEAYVELYCKGTVAPEDLRRSLEQVPEVVGRGDRVGGRPTRSCTCSPRT